MLVFGSVNDSIMTHPCKQLNYSTVVKGGFQSVHIPLLSIVWDQDSKYHFGRFVRGETQTNPCNL